MSTNNVTEAGFSEVEKEAMRARAKELRAEAKANKNREEGEKNILKAIAEMQEPDKSLATKIHALVKQTAPKLFPKTWYGMPAYANDEGKVVCFFQAAKKFDTRYASFGFNESANLDEGNMWATSFAIIKFTDKEESIIVDLLKKAIS